MCKISYLDENGEAQLVHQNSWGFTTRSLGIMIMTHADDKGLVLPPMIAPIQVRLDSNNYLFKINIFTQ